MYFFVVIVFVVMVAIGFRDRSSDVVAWQRLGSVPIVLLHLMFSLEGIKCFSEAMATENSCSDVNCRLAQFDGYSKRWL